MSEPVEEIERHFVVRLRQRALSDMGSGHGLMVQSVGYAIADDWQDGFFEALRSLSRTPRSCPLCLDIKADWRGPEVRQLWYRRTASAPAWRALFVVDSQAGTVEVLHLRHGARRFLTQKESRDILSAG